jgi:cell division septal protein FtsQ
MPETGRDHTLILQNRMKKRRRRKIVFRVFAAACLLFLAAYWASQLPLFRIASISAEDSPSAGADEIASASGLAEGMSGLETLLRDPLGIPTLRLRTAERRIESALPFVEDATVRWILPDKVSIRVVEKEPVFVCDAGGEAFLMDRRTTIIGPASKRPDLDLPSIRGIDAAGKAPGDSLLPENAMLFESLGTLIASIKSLDDSTGWDLFGRVRAYDLSNLYAVCFTIDTGLEVCVGDVRNIDAKLVFLKASFDSGLSGAAGIFTIRDDGSGTLTGNLHK